MSQIVLLVAFAVALVSADPVNLHDWDCTSLHIIATVGQEITPVVCTSDTWRNENRFNPQLPAGLYYEYEGGYTKKMTIKGTPAVPQQTKTYSIGFKEYVTQFRISIAGPVTKLSYGFDYMNQYVGVPIEPIPARSDAYLNNFQINPALPAGVTIDPLTGTISGSFADASTNNQVYTITASNSVGSVTTTVKFVILEQNEMTKTGFISCHWSGTTECRTPAFDYYYQNTAQYCQRETKFDFSDSYEGDGNTWPGLDERFRDYYTSYFYGFINILVEGNYNFYMNSDDASFLYLDTLDEPLINRDGCRGASWVDDTASKFLTTGRHLFVAKFLEVNGAATMHVEIESIDANIPRGFIDDKISFVGGRGPTFITYPLVSGYTNAELKVVTPEMVSGGANEWTVNPALPVGITLDQHRGQIRGKPTAAYSGFHTVTAVGYNGAASTAVHIVIADTPLPGFHAKYYKVVDSEICMYSSLAPSQIELKVVKIDSQINYPTSLPGIWPGLPNDFTNYYYAEWEGYLHHTEIGNWKLKLSCDDACRLWSIEDTLQIDNWKTGQYNNYCHAWASVEKTIAISSVGYYYYKIRYIQKTESKGIVLEWQAPNGNWEVVPADKIFHAAPSMLSYDFEKSHYFKNIDITPNNPHLFHVTTCNNYRSSPALPTGITIQPTTGIISGKPTGEQLETVYTITCTSNTGDISTTVNFDVYYVMPPSGLSFKQGGMMLSPNQLVTLLPVTPMEAITVSGDTDLISYTITPELPEGLVFHPDTGKIDGTPYEPRAEKTYTVVATNSGGILPLTIRIAVTGCKGNNGGAWDSTFTIIDMLTGVADISVLANDQVTECSTGSFGQDGNAIMSPCSKFNVAAGQKVAICMKSTPNAQIKITCKSASGCYSQTRRPDGNRWPTRFTYNPNSEQPFVETYAYPSSLTPLTSVTIEPAETTIYSGSPMSTVSIIPNGCFKSISIEPKLGGENYEINLRRPTLDGYVSSDGKSQIVYTITATGEAGTATGTLTAHFTECGADGKTAILKSLLRVTRYGDQVSFEIYKDNANDQRNMVFSLGNDSPLASYAEYVNTICAPTGNYEVIMRDSVGDGWYPGTYLKFYDRDDVLIQEFTYGTTSGSNYEKHGYLTVAGGSAEHTKWKLLLDDDAKHWNEIDFDDSKWTDSTASLSYGPWQQNTVYARHTFTVDEAIKYPLVQFNVWYKDGIIVYLNGNEVYRRNMPAGKASKKTLASGKYDGYYRRIGSAPGYLLQDGLNVIAVEVHKHESTNGDIQFQGFANPLQGDCISRIDGGSITESSFWNQPSESAAQAWDRNEGTTWIENGAPAWTIYSYNFDRMEWVNRLSIVSNPKRAAHDPISIKLSGSTNGVDWDTLFEYYNKQLFTFRSQRREFMMMDHMNSYSKYKFEMLESASGTPKLALSVLDLMSCQLNYCVKDSGFPGVMSDEISVAPCPGESIGEMYRKCSLAALKPSWEEPDMTECRSTVPPKKKVYIDVAFYITNVNTETVQALVGTLTNTFANVVEVSISNTEMWKIKDVTTEYPELQSVVSAYWIRVVLDEGDATSKLKAVTNCLTTYVSTLKRFNDEGSGLPTEFEIGFYMKPLLQERKGLGGVSIALIVILVILVVIIGSVVGFWIWVRTKSKKSKNGARQLRSGAGKVNAQHLSGSKDVRV